MGQDLSRSRTNKTLILLHIDYKQWTEFRDCVCVAELHACKNTFVVYVYDVYEFEEFHCKTGYINFGQFEIFEI